MKFSRRSFLQLLSIASIGITVAPKQSVVANNETYVNKKLGIAFKIPEGWYFYHVQEMQKMAHRQIVKPDAILYDELLEEINQQPLVVMGQHSPYDEKFKTDFTPSIVLRLEKNDKNISAEEILDESDSYLSTLVNDYKPIERKPITTINSYKVVQGKYSYLFEAEGMKPTQIIGRSCIICTEDHYYSFNMYNYNPINSKIDNLFTKFIANIIVL